MPAKKKIKKPKKVNVRTPEDVKILGLINEVAEMCRDCQEIGSPPTHKVVEMQSNLWKYANDKGYKRDNWYGNFE
jgi:hypothetical protein